MLPAGEKVQFVADRGDIRLRLDQSIVRHLFDVSPLSRNRVQIWIDEGRVRVNGIPARRAAAKAPEGANVEVELPPGIGRRQPPTPESTPLSIIYEDDVLLAIDKPAGMVVHPSYKQRAGTLLNAVLGHRVERTTEPGIITRLDKQTSGLVLVAIAPNIHRIVQADAQIGLVKKEYLAIVEGCPSPRTGVIDVALGRDANDRRRVTASAGGVNAITRYEMLATHAGRSLVRCELVTGRTHQIRSHLAFCGWPLVGDAVYGTRDAELGDRQALHAWRVTLPHPVSRQPLELTAPLPSDLVAAAHLVFSAADLT